MADEEEAKLARRCGTAIKNARQAKSWTQADLAEAADISVNYVSYVERGGRLPSVPMLVRLARILHTTTSALLGEESEDEWERQAMALLAALPVESRPMILAMLQGAAVPPRSPAPVTAPRKGSAPHVGVSVRAAAKFPLTSRSAVLPEAQKRKPRPPSLFEGEPTT